MLLVSEGRSQTDFYGHARLSAGRTGALGSARHTGRRNLRRSICLELVARTAGTAI